MKGIFEAITNFFSFVTSYFEFVIKMYIFLFKLLSSGINILINLVNLLPLPFVMGSVALILVCVVYKILGRENQS